MSDSTLKPEVLAKYKDRANIFIETGTARGEGTQEAIDAGFERIVTIEANPEAFHKACMRFAFSHEVQCVLGDSGKVLPSVLMGIAERCVFWLDAHISTGEEDLGPSVDKCPVLQDLGAIAGHAVKDHVIMIDDIRYFRTGLPMWNGIRLGDIIDVIMAINPAYQVHFEDGHEPNDILVAEVPDGQG